MKKNRISAIEATQIMKRLKDRTPSKELVSYVHDELMKNRHYLFQYKEGNTRYGYCTHCRKKIQLEHLRIDTPEVRQVLSAYHNQKVTCPHCNYELTKRYAGYNCNNEYVLAAECYVDSSTNAMIIHIYQFLYRFYEEKFTRKADWWTYNIGYFSPHQHFTNLYSSYSGMNIYIKNKYFSSLYFTKSKNWQGMRDIVYLYKFDEAVAKSDMKYMQPEFWISETNSPPLFQYLFFYCENPELSERMIKQGFGSVIYSYCSGRANGVIDFTKKEPLKALRLTKKQAAQIKKENPISINSIRTFQLINAHPKLHEKDYEKLGEYIDCSVNFVQLKRVLFKLLNFTSLNKVLKYMQVNGSCRYSYTSSYANFINMYLDYESQCVQLGYDLSRKEIAMPQNLQVAHQELSDFINKQKHEAELKMLQIKQDNFTKNILPKLEKLSFEANGLIIRPARNAEELLQEGTTNHNCVYSNYREQHLNGKTAIFVIRRNNEPDKTFFTLEYKDGMVIQCRTLHNEGMTPEVKAFVDLWVKFIKSNTNKSEVA